MSSYTFVFVGGLFQSQKRRQNIHRYLMHTIASFLPSSKLIYIEGSYFPARKNMTKLGERLEETLLTHTNIILIWSSSGALMAYAVLNKLGHSKHVKAVILIAFSRLTKLLLPTNYRRYLQQENTITPLITVGGYFDVIAPFFTVHFKKSTCMNLYCGHLALLREYNLKTIFQTLISQL